MKRPLFWHQGLFLQPHHFQQEDLYLQALCAPFHRFLQPHFWGVGEVVVHEAGLGNFAFNLVSGEFLFPDMTHVTLPGNGNMSARSFDGAWIEGGKPFTVYVGLKKLSRSSENVTVVSGSEDNFDISTRFVTKSDPESVQDLYQDGPSADIKKLQYVLKIFWETEIDQVGDYTLIPVAQMERSGEEIRLSDRFIPPSLTLSASPILMRTIQEVRDQMSSRGHQLESYKQERGIHTAEFGARDMVYLLALRSLNRYVPILTHFTETQKVHPWIVYGVLRQLIGELSSFSAEVNVAGESTDGTRLVFDYDHRGLWESFSSAQSLVTRLLDEITAGPEYVFQLVYDGTYYACELPPAVFEGRNRFYLVLETDADPDTILKSFEAVAKFGCRESLPILIARALPGIKLKHLPVPPQELPRRARSIYFEVDHHADQWGQVEKNHNIGMYWDAAPEDLKIELMVVGRS